MSDIAMSVWEFDSDEEAKEAGKDKLRSKYDYRNAKINGEDVILCCTNMVYEDEIWNAASKIYDWLTGFLPECKRKAEYDYCDAKSDIRDFIIKCFEEYEDIRFLDAFDEY